MTSLYSTAKASKIVEFEAIVDDLYNYDAHQYSLLKTNEGQYAYFEYMKNVRLSVENIFYKPLPGRCVSLSDTIKLSKEPLSSSTCIMLNNTSLLGHVTVLRSIAKLLLKYSQKGDLFAAVLNPESLQAEDKLRRYLNETGLKTIQLPVGGMARRLYQLHKSIKPRQYIWWGWPPGQWLGPLIAKDSVHRSVSFKYDFPIADRFTSHHIGYGDKYASHIFDNCKIFGFNQHFCVDMIPSLSRQKVVNFKKFLKSKSIQNPLRGSHIINVGTLGRSEKIAQPSYLLTIKKLLDSDPRIIFHWTGRSERKDINNFFEKENLSNRVTFHGWVSPFDYLTKLDIYLDTFPFGTGETFVSAGLLGLPLIAMNSPYEANFTNLFAPNPLLRNIIASRI